MLVSPEILILNKSRGAGMQGLYPDPIAALCTSKKAGKLHPDKNYRKLVLLS